MQRQAVQYLADRWPDFVSDLTDRGYSPNVHLEVPWNTLTATVRELMKSSRRRPTATELDAIGAYVGKIVKLKNQRED